MGMVPNNVLVVKSTQSRSVLAILNAREENSGDYECIALSGVERASASVEITTG